CGVWLAVAFTLKYSSLAALLASLAAPVLLWLWGQTVFAGAAAFMTLLLLWKHRSNIQRLRSGEEPRIGAKS
ncbi:MAG: glycerol-3-phosphate acyltransferase, partial [Hyphomicrobium sp.]